jgi:hypothetical protein
MRVAEPGLGSLFYLFFVMSLIRPCWARCVAAQARRELVLMDSEVEALHESAEALQQAAEAVQLRAQEASPCQGL